MPHTTRFDWSGDDVSVMQSCIVWIDAEDLYLRNHHAFILGDAVEWLLFKPWGVSQPDDPRHYDYWFGECAWGDLDEFMKLSGKIIQINGCWDKEIPDANEPIGFRYLDVPKYIPLQKADGQEYEVDAEGLTLFGYDVHLTDVRIAPVKPCEIDLR